MAGTGREPGTSFSRSRRGLPRASDQVDAECEDGFPAVGDTELGAFRGPGREPARGSVGDTLNPPRSGLR